MNLAQLAINNSRITIIGIIIIAFIGIQTYLSYPSAEDPTIQIRSASVQASFPGMSPERVEELITKPLETALREIAEIEDIESTSKTGATKISVTLYDWVTDLEPVFQDIRNKVADVTPNLPEGTSTPTIEDDEGLTAVATVALWADGFSLAEMRDVATRIRERIYTLDGIRRVDVMGVQPERIYLETTPARLAEFGVAPQQIFSALANQNIIEPGGQIVADSRTIVLEPSGDLGAVEDIANVVFEIPGTGQVYRLGDLVTVERSNIDPPQFPAFYNDRPAVVLAVSTVEGVNNVEFGTRLSALLGDIQQELPIGYVLDYATFQPTLIAQAVDSAVSNVYQTLAIVLAVVLVFLGIRTGLIVGCFVPLTMLLGIIVMRLYGVELQRMSIAGTIIALGLLVDNGIVVAEDIRSRLERGIERRKAAAQSGGTLALPLLTSSLTTIFAFLPMLLLEGGAGEYVMSLAQVVMILLLGSWLLSMTVTPFMCATFMKVPKATGAAGKEIEPAYNGIVYRFYCRVLGLFLRFRLIGIAALVLLMVGSVQLFGLLKVEFFPLGDRNQLLVYMDLEAGTDARETETQLRKLTAWLSDTEENPEVASTIAYVGFGGPRFFLALSPVDPDPHRGFVLVNTHSVDDVRPMMARINAFLDANIPAARADAKQMWFGSTEPGLLQLRLIGPDDDVLLDAADRLVAALHDIPQTVGIKHDWENAVLALNINVDQVRARRAGVTSSDVAMALSTFFAGTPISDYREGDQVIPIVLRGDDGMRLSLSSLQRIQIYSSTKDDFVSLGQVATVTPEWRTGRIIRLNQQRTLTVEARNPALGAPGLLQALEPALQALDLPAGHRFEIGGEIEDQAESNSRLFGLLPLALAGIIVLLVGQFNSIRKGGIIVATIPLISIGGVLGLVIMNAPFGFMVILGFFSLAGIIINNGIVLIDRIQAESQDGRDPLDAVAVACLARLRPILMTTLTTVLGLIPLIAFGGALFYGMASVIAFGLIVATLITLAFVPALYTLLFRIPTRNAPSVVANAGKTAPAA